MCRFVALGLLLLLGACEPTDRPKALGEPVPERVSDLLSPDTARTVRVAPGVTYRYVWSGKGPWAVHVLEADLTSCRVGFAVVRAPGDPGTDEARAPVSRLVGLAPEGAVAGVNGDFFTPEGLPRGPELSTRGLRASQRRPAFSWSALTGPRIGVAEIVDGVLVMESAPHDPEVLVGGYPELLRRGEPLGELGADPRTSFAGVRHPRTAVGFARNPARLWIVVVEGRLGPRSAGMTLAELTELLAAVGAERALNLDGGGSSVMVLGVRPVSRPSEDGEERAVANALVVRSTPALCDASVARTD
ncbi:MAG: phosphodiester glycosidase family protein [Longimicrobiales bacterium]